MHLVDGYAVVQVAQRFGQNGLCLDLAAQAIAGRSDQRVQLVHVQRHALAPVHDMQRRCGRCFLHRLVLALLRAVFTVQHVGAGDLVVPATHQAELDLVLHVFNVKGAAAGA